MKNEEVKRSGDQYRLSGGFHSAALIQAAGSNRPSAWLIGFPKRAKKAKKMKEKDKRHHGDMGIVAVIKISPILRFKFVLLLNFSFILGCALTPSKSIGVDRKYVVDSMMVEMHGHPSRVLILDSNSLEDLDSLSSVSYFGSESKYHIFIQWSKAAAPPNDVTLFALDSSFCHLKSTFPIEKEDNGRQKQRPVSFKKMKCEFR
jgi:hypothetical protein